MLSVQFNSLWPQTHLSIESDNVKDFLQDIAHRDVSVREPATRALPKLLEMTHGKLIPFILADLFDIYTKHNKARIFVEHREKYSIDVFV
jgi:hypothetical protein